MKKALFVLLLSAGLVLSTLGSPFGCSTLSNLIDACDLSFEDVQQQNGISDGCRDAIESLLPEAQNNAASRLVVLGTEMVGGQRILYLHGIDSGGSPFTTEELQGASVTVIDGGTETALPAADFAITSLEGVTDDLVSLSVVTDYSGSMADSDLDTAAEIFTDVFNILPPIFEAEVVLFSETVTQKLAFTEDRDALLAAVARDDSVERSSTALYDGMGTALSHLVARERPIRVLIASTDGLENASTGFTKDQLTATIGSNRILVLMLGSLFSDVDELKELAGTNGVYFYAPSYSSLKSSVANYITSLGEAVRITLDAAHQNADSARITVDGVSTTVSF